MMRSRPISSEAPEVVPQQQNLMIADSQEVRIERKKVHSEKQSAGYQSPTSESRSPTSRNGPGDENPPASLSSPQGTQRGYQTPGDLYDLSDLSSYGAQVAFEPSVQSRRGYGLVTMIILVIVAFTVGGGIGGGVGGAIAASDKRKLRQTFPSVCSANM